MALSDEQKTALANLGANSAGIAALAYALKGLSNDKVGLAFGSTSAGVIALYINNSSFAD